MDKTTMPKWLQVSGLSNTGTGVELKVKINEYLEKVNFPMIDKKNDVTKSYHEPLIPLAH